MESPTMNAIKDGIEGIGKHFAEYKKSSDEKLEKMRGENTALLERVEELEARGSNPSKHGGSDKSELNYKVFSTNTGDVVQIPSNVKLSDVLKPEKQAPISLERWLHALVSGDRCPDKKAREFFNDTKALETGTTGVLIPEEFQTQWIDLLRSQMVLNAAGMQTRSMSAKVQTSSAVASDPTASWHTEAASISAANPTFALRQLEAKTIVARCQGSVELAQDSPDFGQQLGAVMTRAIAQEVDRAGLEGSGTPPEPRGIENTSGIGQVSSVGTTSDFTKIISGVQTLLAANVPLEIAVANLILSPYAWARYENLLTGISGDKTQLARPKSLESTAFRVTTSILDGSPLSSTMYMGDFRDLILGVRREASIEILKATTFASNLLLEFVAYGRFDFLVQRLASFVKLTGLT